MKKENLSKFARIEQAARDVDQRVNKMSKPDKWRAEMRQNVSPLIREFVTGLNAENAGDIFTHLEQYGNTVLHVAAEINDPSLCKCIVSSTQFGRELVNEPQLFSNNGHFQTPFYIAIETGSLEIVELFLNQTPVRVFGTLCYSPMGPATNYSPLGGAIIGFSANSNTDDEKEQRAEIIRKLLENGADVNERSFHCPLSTLQTAMRTFRRERAKLPKDILEMLISRVKNINGVPCDEASFDFEAPLLPFLLDAGMLDGVKLCKKYGADFSKYSILDYIDRFSFHERLEIFETLQEYGLDPRCIDKEKNTVVHKIASLSSFYNPDEFKQICTAAGKSAATNELINAKNADGQTPLAVLLQNGTTLKSECLMEFLSLGANLVHMGKDSTLSALSYLIPGKSTEKNIELLNTIVPVMMEKSLAGKDFREAFYADIQRIDSLNVGSAKDASENNELTPKQKNLVKKLLRTLEKMEKNKGQKTEKVEIER